MKSKKMIRFLLILSSVVGALGCACTPFGNTAQLNLYCLPSGYCSSPLSSLPGNLAQDWTNLKQCADGTYLDGAGLSCQTGTISGQTYQSNCSIGTCLPCRALTGTYVSACQSVSTVYNTATVPNFAISACTNAPSGATYVSNSSVLFQSACSFKCSPGTFYKAGAASCTTCSTSCPAGQQTISACTTTANTLSTTSNDSDLTCGPCTNSANVLSYSSGCTIATCAAGYVVVNSACTPAFSPPPPPPSPPPPPTPPPPDHDTGLSCGPSVALISVTGTISPIQSSVLYNKGSFGTSSNGQMTNTLYNSTSRAVNLAGPGYQIFVPFSSANDYFSVVERIQLPSSLTTTTILQTSLTSTAYIIVSTTDVYVFMNNNAGSKFYLGRAGSLPTSSATMTVFATCASSGLYCYGSYLV